MIYGADRVSLPMMAEPRLDHINDGGGVDIWTTTTLWGMNGTPPWLNQIIPKSTCICCFDRCWAERCCQQGEPDLEPKGTAPKLDKLSCVEEDSSSMLDLGMFQTDSGAFGRWLLLWLSFYLHLYFYSQMCSAVSHVTQFLIRARQAQNQVRVHLCTWKWMCWTWVCSKTETKEVKSPLLKLISVRCGYFCQILSVSLVGSHINSVISDLPEDSMRINACSTITLQYMQMTSAL